MNETERAAGDSIRGPKAALAHYADAQSLRQQLTPMRGSLVNQTWAVGRPPRFALQRVAPIFGDAENVRIEAIGRRLAAAGVGAPTLIRTDSGELSLEGDGGRHWRLLTWLPGTSHHLLPSAAHGKSAAALLARFHDALCGSPEGEALPVSHFHDTPARMATLEQILTQGRRASVAKGVDRLGVTILSAWREWQATAPAPPPRPGHGDLKLSNFLFDADRPLATALIDFDTLGRYGLDAELGDALRSWCNPTGEDTDRPGFETASFEAAVAGYLGQSQTIRADERALIVHGLGRIALELAARFLIDAVEDQYFAWNPAIAPSRRAHNLLRAKGQLALWHHIVEGRRQLEQLVRRYA